MSPPILGIDLGTTNSEVAIVRDGRVRVLPVDDSKIMPSVVGLADDGSLLIGQSARNQYTLYPERTVRSIKRRMGEDVQVTLGGQEFSPQEISALILKRLRQAAEEALGEPLSKAVITVPAYFSDAQRQATRDAGILAGLEVMRIINEPTAAALAYEVEHQEAKNILVYDLGGGTFDVSVVRLSKGVTEVLSSHGNNHLGGDDFDAKIVAHLLSHLQTQGIDPGTNRAAMARIERAAENAKIVLSDHPFAKIREEYLLEHEGQPVHLNLELSREHYENLIASFVDETLEAVHTALEGAGLNITDLAEVLLVGGATRTPLVQRRLEKLLGMPPRSELDPDLCVASGAAIQAAVIAGDQVAGILVDVTPYTFGTDALSELHGELYPHCFIPLIRKNTPIPVTKSEVFSTIIDGQSSVDVSIYQGEDPDSLNNTKIGSFLIEGLSQVSAGNPIIVTFALDINGILKVTAREKRTGLEKQVTIENATARFANEHMTAARERLGALLEEGEPKAKSQGREAVQARALIEKAERFLDQANEEDKEDLINLIEAVRDALDQGEESTLKESMGELADLLFYMES